MDLIFSGETSASVGTGITSAVALTSPESMPSEGILATYRNVSPIDLAILNDRIFFSPFAA